MKAFLVAILAIGLISCNRNNDPKPDTSGIFLKFFGNANANSGFSIAETSEGFIIAGASVPTDQDHQDAFVIKTDKNGNRIWENRYGDDGNDDARSVVTDASGNIHLVGKYEYEDATTDMMYLMLNSNGKVIREKKIGSPALSEEGLFITRTNDGGVLLAGLQKTASDQRMFLAKVVQDSLYWKREVGTIGLNDAIGSIIQLNTDSSLYWAGTADKLNETNIRLVKSDKEGNLLWSKEYGELDNLYQYCRKLVYTGGKLVMVGSIGAENKGNETMYFLQSDLNGNFSTGKEISSGHCGGYDITPTSDGGFAALGYKQNNSEDTNFLLVKVDNSGGDVWEKEFGGSRNDYGMALLEAQDGGLAMVGTAEVYADKNYLINFIKCDKDGNMYEKKK